MLCFCFVRLRLVSPVSLDCQFLIAPSVFPFVYLMTDHKSNKKSEMTLTINEAYHTYILPGSKDLLGEHLLMELYSHIY